MRARLSRTYLIFGDIAGKLDVLRKGRYSVRTLIEKYGRRALPVGLPTPDLTICIVFFLYVYSGYLYIARFGLQLSQYDEFTYAAMAADFSRLFVYEPFFYGQDYNFPLEAWIAAPLAATRLVDPLISVKIAAYALFIAPFALAGSIAHNRGQSHFAFAIWILPFLSSIFFIISPMPRGFINGTAIATLAAILFVSRPEAPLLEKAFYFCCLAIAFHVNPSASLVVVPVLTLVLIEAVRYPWQKAAQQVLTLWGTFILVAVALLTWRSSYFINHPTFNYFSIGESPGSVLVQGFTQRLGRYPSLLKGYDIYLACIIALTCWGSARLLINHQYRWLSCARPSLIIRKGRCGSGIGAYQLVGVHSGRLFTGIPYVLATLLLQHSLKAPRNAAEEAFTRRYLPVLSCLFFCAVVVLCAFHLGYFVPNYNSRLSQGPGPGGHVRTAMSLTGARSMSAPARSGHLFQRDTMRAWEPICGRGHSRECQAQARHCRCCGRNTSCAIRRARYRTGRGVYFSRTVLFWDAVYFRFMASRMTDRKERQASIRSVPIATAHPTGWTGELLAVAVRHHRSGALAEAERRYQEILAIDPKHAESLHFLGGIAYQLGRNEQALDLIGRAIVLNDRVPAFHNNIGLVLHGLGRMQEAAVHYTRAIGLKPDFADAHNNLANALQEQGRFDEAVARYHQALALRPDFAEAHNNLGTALREQGQLDEAGSEFQRAMTVKPGFAEAQNNLGNAFRNQGKLTEAMAKYQRALALKPDYAEAYSNLGAALQEQGRVHEAVIRYRQALALKPNYAKAHNNLGIAFREQGQLDEAGSQFQRAVTVKPDFAEARNNLGNAFKDEGKLSEAVAQYRQALALRPNFPEAHSNLLFCLLYSETLSANEIRAAHEEWDVRYARGRRRPSAYRNDRTVGRRLKVGYVSGDFRQHSVAWFFGPLLAAHDRAAIEIFCYAEVKRPDHVTARFKALADHWRVTVGSSDEAVAAQIAADGIDILVDLAGHTAANRLLVFALKPAPVQVTWLGYPHCTGLSAIDYRLVDGVTDPKDDITRTSSEKLVRLDGTFACYGPLADAPPPAPPPGLSGGIITFGSFNNPTKYSIATMDAWAELLRRVPGSVLLLKGLPFADASMRASYLARFNERGVLPQRITLVGPTPYGAYLTQYNEIDIALDPFPWNGHTTTCEALWMGVPVVTLRGDRHCGRIGASLLTSVGLDELIANNVEEYVDIAMRLAQHRSRLAHLRNSLREQMGASPLCDAPRFARKIETAYRSMWRLWCEENSESLQSR